MATQRLLGVDQVSDIGVNPQVAQALAMLLAAKGGGAPQGAVPPGALPPGAPGGAPPMPDQQMPPEMGMQGAGIGAAPQGPQLPELGPTAQTLAPPNQSLPVGGGAPPPSQMPTGMTQPVMAPVPPGAPPGPAGPAKGKVPPMKPPMGAIQRRLGAPPSGMPGQTPGQGGDLVRMLLGR